MPRKENENYPHLKGKTFHKDLFNCIVFGFFQASSKKVSGKLLQIPFTVPKKTQGNFSLFHFNFC